MNPVFIEVMFDCLTSITSTYITILVPFIGALYIYKKTTRSSAESKIFQIGRSICDILETKLVALPWPAINIHSFIERHIPFEKYTNKDEAITETLIESISAFSFEEDEKNASKLAERIITIIHYRYDSLVPAGVSWSGRGPMFGIEGINKSSKDTFFPFGTLLYREWINNFSVHYNDVWRGLTFSRASELSKKLHYHIDESESYYQSHYEGIINWAKDLDEKMNAINKFHSQLITQIQIIDFNISEVDLLRALKTNGIYLLLLSVSGYLLPTLLFKLNLLNAIDLAALSSVSIFLIALIPFNLISKKDVATNAKRNSIYISLKNNLRLPNKKQAKFYSGFLQTFCQIRKKLSIPTYLIEKAQEIIDAMALASDLSIKIHAELDPYFKHLENKIISISESSGANNGAIKSSGATLSTIDLIDQSYDFSSTIKGIQTSDSYLSISKHEHGSSRDLFKYSLDSPEGRGAVIDGLLSIRNEFKDRDDVINLLYIIENIYKESELLKEMLSKETDGSKNLNSHASTIT